MSLINSLYFSTFSHVSTFIYTSLYMSLQFLYLSRRFHYLSLRFLYIFLQILCLALHVDLPFSTISLPLSTFFVHVDLQLQFTISLCSSLRSYNFFPFLCHLYFLYVSLHFSTILYISLHFSTFIYITLHFSTFLYFLCMST